MTKSLRLLGLLAGLIPGLAARADASLAANSPFASPEGANAVAAENQPLELRGILADGEGFRFSIYDPAKKSGQWVRLNEPGHDFTVKTHDVGRDSITLDYQGRRLILPLRAGKVVAVAVSETPRGPRPTPGGSGAGPVPKAATAEESARFNRAVEEINRRRALREKGPLPTPSSGATAPMPAPRPRQ